LEGRWKITFTNRGNSLSCLCYHVAWFLQKGKWPSRQIDHDNRDSLDDSWGNLRYATTSKNAMNKDKNLGYAGNPCSSRYKGISWNKTRRKWRAFICFQGKSKFLGSFDMEIDAAMAYDSAARDLFGEFAVLNFPSRQECLR